MTKSCHVAITDVRKCVMQAPVVTVPEQATGNVHVDKLVSTVCATYHCFGKLCLSNVSGLIYTSTGHKFVAL